MQLATMPLPPNDSSGNVSPFVGSTPMLTPMLMNVWMPIQTPMPCATSAANGRDSRAAWRPIAYARNSSHANSAITAATPTKPSSSAMTASRKSVCASGRYSSFSTLAPEARRRAIRRARTRSANATAGSPCAADRTTGRGSSSAAARGTARRSGSPRARPAAATARPRNSRQSRPPRNRMPNAIARITTNAPKSGSSSSRPPISTMTADSGAKPRSSVCRSGCSACRNAALRTA